MLSSEPVGGGRPGAARLWAGAAALIIIAGLAWAFWTWRANRMRLDDAFISYRYAENLVRGRGLVFNPGERVEGYTNFLWVLFSAAAMRIGADSFAATRSLGVASYLAVVATCGALLALRLRGRPWYQL